MSKGNFLKKLLVVTVALAAFGSVGWSLFTAEITETMTYDSAASDFDADVYKFVVTSAIAAADTVVIDNFNGRLFSISHLGNRADSAITLNIYSGEATLDSIRHNLLWQVSNVGSPSRAIANQTDWQTALTTSGAGSGLDSVNYNIVQFRPGRYGQFKWFRLLINESDTDKDATQTVTGYIRIPKPTVPQR